MKVKELIEILQKEDQEELINIRIYNDESAWLSLGVFPNRKELDIDLNEA